MAPLLAEPLWLQGISIGALLDILSRRPKEIIVVGAGETSCEEYRHHEGHLEAEAEHWQRAPHVVQPTPEPPRPSPWRPTLPSPAEWEASRPPAKSWAQVARKAAAASPPALPKTPTTTKRAEETEGQEKTQVVQQVTAPMPATPAASGTLPASTNWADADGSDEDQPTIKEQNEKKDVDHCESWCAVPKGRGAKHSAQLLDRAAQLAAHRKWNADVRFRMIDDEDNVMQVERQNKRQQTRKKGRRVPGYSATGW